MRSQIWWYLARASGIVAWLMLTASILWGTVLSSKAFPKHRRPAWLLDLHRWLGALTLGLVALHISALVADSYVHFGPAEVLVPWASAWKPTAVALGVIGAWLLVLVQATSLVMRRLPRRVWHGIHLASYATFVLGTLHAVLAGTDRSAGIFQISGAVVVLAVALAVASRYAGYRQGRRDPARRPAVELTTPRSGARGRGTPASASRAWR